MSSFYLKDGSREIQLNEGITIVGREAGTSDVVLEGKGVSRAHCRFIVEAGEISVEDLGSKNGVRVNGKRIDRKSLLSPGDAVQMGEKTISVFKQQPDRAPAAAPSAAPAAPARHRRKMKIPVGPIALALLVIAGLAVYFNLPDGSLAHIRDVLSRTEAGLERVESTGRDAADAAVLDGLLRELAVMEQEAAGLDTAGYPAEAERRKAVLEQAAELKARLTARQADCLRTAELEAVKALADEAQRLASLERFQVQYTGSSQALEAGRLLAGLQAQIAARSREAFDQAAADAQAAAAERDYRRGQALLAPYLADPAGPFAEQARRALEGITRTALAHFSEAEREARELLRNDRFTEAAALAEPFVRCGVEEAAASAVSLVEAVHKAENAKRARIEQAVKGLFTRAESLLSERDFTGAAAVLREALDMGGAVVDPDLPLRAEQAAVLGEMKLAIIAAAAQAAFPSYREGETIKAADSTSLTIASGDMDVKILWKAVSIDDIVALAGSAGKAGVGSILLTLARYHLAREEFDTALELLDEARRRNIDLPAVLKLTAEAGTRRNAAFERIEEERRKSAESEAAGLLTQLAEAEKTGDTETMLRLYRECTGRYSGTEAVTAQQALLDRVKEALGAKAAQAEPQPRNTVVLKERSEAEIIAFRPRLIFDPVRLAELKKSPFRTDVDSMLSQNRGNDVIHYAFSYAVNGNKKNGQTAVDMALRIAAGEQDINKNDLHPSAAGVAYVYDWCHDLLTDADRKRMTDWLNKLYAQYLNDGYDTPLHNYSFANIHTFTMAGYATLGENDKAPAMIKEARRRWEDIMMPGLLLAARGGAWPEGESYGQGVMASMMGVLETMYNTAGIDYYTPAEDFLLQRLAYNLFFIYPGSPPAPGGGLKWHHVFRGDGDVFKNTDNEMVTRLNLTRRYHDTDIGQYAAWFSAQSRMARANFGSGYVYEALYRDNTVPQKNPKDWKLTHFSPGGGIVLMKSSWKDDATHVTFDSGPLFCGHDHADQNSFMIYKKGFLTFDSGTYKGVTDPWSVDYYCRSIAHNTVTVFQAGEKMIARRQNAANDGGQVWKEYEASTLSEVKNFKGGPYEAGSIIALDYNDLYTYAVGDAAKAYAPGKVKEFKRHLLFLRPDTVIVFDRVTAAQEGAKKRWHLHTTGEPTVNGSLVTATCQGGKLFCRTLLPDKPEIKVIDGFEVDGRKLKPPGETVYPEWRIDVSPTADEKTTLFVHVLYAGDAGTQAMPPCSVTDEGTTIEISTGAFKVRFAKSGVPGGILMAGGRKVELANKISKEF